MFSIRVRLMIGFQRCSSSQWRTSWSICEEDRSTFADRSSRKLTGDTQVNIEHGDRGGCDPGDPACLAKRFRANAFELLPDFRGKPGNIRIGKIQRNVPSFRVAE